MAGLALVLFSARAATADVAGTATTAGVETRLTSVMVVRAKNGLDLQTG
jgi:hypothetical protein